ncbi:MAG TPA: hypothetical protein VNU70_08945 [Puia sp.]|jgi:hypothetical protein|nr:hypothetical protein [Puia sp.]
MERLKELITKLKDQLDSKTGPSQMLETVRLLEAELHLAANQPAPARAMPTKITVMMPSASKINAGGAGQPAPETRKDVGTQRNGSAIPQAPAGINGQVPAPAATPAPATTGVAAPATATLERPQERGVWPFDPLAEKPTDRFTLSQKSREVNDVIGTSSTSLNDKLKSEVADLKSALNDTPVRDLRKAIGVNDRYVFINQLFRGDEVMYERSLKTINGFRILPEAEYWMERELKVKLGWDENNQTTRHFYQLVKRRFS